MPAPNIIEGRPMNHYVGIDVSLPCFCAQAGWPIESANRSEPAAMQRKYCITILSSLYSWLGRRIGNEQESGHH